MKNGGAIVRFRVALSVFVIGLVLSGVTAFPLLTELRIVCDLIGPATKDHGIIFWIESVRDGLTASYHRYPWIAYGTDWLAFGHLVIAFFFVGPLIHPETARGNLIAGMVACVAIFPLALIGGPLRGVPLLWQLIDCSFGVIGILPLIYCFRLLPEIKQSLRSVEVVGL
jgi:hypothetical protein